MAADASVANAAPTMPQRLISQKLAPIAIAPLASEIHIWSLVRFATAKPGAKKYICDSKAAGASRSTSGPAIAYSGAPRK
jgi:hypothetical protein